MKVNKRTRNVKDQKLISRYDGSLLKRISSLSGKEILDRILEQEDPRSLIQQLPHGDFFWLVKKVGDNDCLPLLEWASEDQWQYLLDLELWQKDRFQIDCASRWIGKLQQADIKRLVRWFFGKGQAIAYCYFFRSIQVMAKQEDEAHDLPDDFFTLDGIFYVRTLDKEHRETIENILRTMSDEDLDRCHTFLLGLSGVLPAELEEDMYRLKNVRLAEHGFLPFEEALSVYAPLGPENLTYEKPVEMVNDTPLDEEIRELAPIAPLVHAEGQNLWTAVSSRITDNQFLNRVRLEFGGLCNQIFSADGELNNELEALIKTCQKAAGYLNLALEKLCGSDISSAEKLVRKNSLVSIFRVGFGLALGQKWETERWLKNSWFNGQGLDFNFWGHDWGERLAGLVATKPSLYVGYEGGEEYRDFEKLSELEDCNRILNRVMVLDTLLARLAELYPLHTKIIVDSRLSFHPLLFNLFARKLLKLEPGLSGISHRQARKFIGNLRAGDKKPPYKMSAFEEIFIRDIMAYAEGLEPGPVGILKDTLSLLWREFYEEYEWVPLEDLDDKFQRFLWIIPSPGVPAR
ncbi:MAG: hypothetical protein JSV50_18015 [Desulfobacteraceae bacterium]|nr:MAG: hypothetical protein JSV50_18015 [Desulfobacteraceae bacterium]